MARMKRFEFATYSERSFYEVEAASEEEARKLLEDDPEEYYTGRHHDCIDYELIDVDGDDEPEETPPDTPALDTSFHDHEMNVG